MVIKLKKIIVIFLSVLLFASFLPKNVLAEDYYSTFNGYLDAALNIIDKSNDNLKSDENIDISFVKDNVPMVPVRSIAQIAGASVEYIPQIDGVLLKSDEATALITDNSNQILTDNGIITSATETIEQNGTLYVPVNDSAKALGLGSELFGDTAIISHPFQTKRLIVQTDDITLNSFGAIAASRSAEYPTIFQYATERDAENACADLKGSSDVQSVETPEILTASGTLITENNAAASLINWENYNKYYSSKMITVAVLDTGLQPNDAIFSQRIASGVKNFITNNTNVNDMNGHGTFVAGVIAQFASNNVKILPLKVLNDQGIGTSDVAMLALLYATSLKVNVANMSLSGRTDKIPADLKYAVDNAYASGIIMVAAAGNADQSEGEAAPAPHDAKYYAPANMDHVIAVGATDNNGNIASYSNFGNAIDIWAPGTISSTYINNAWATASGTSMAAPVVASAISNVLTVRSDVNAGNAVSFLQSKAKTIGRRLVLNMAGFIENKTSATPASYAIPTAKPSPTPAQLPTALPTMLPATPILNVSPIPLPAPSSAPIQFVDTENHVWALEAINSLSARGIIKGYGSTFQPDSNITRGDYALMLARVLGLTENSADFADVYPNDYFSGAIGALQKAGLINGLGNGTFAPNDNISRQDLFVMAYRILLKKGTITTGDSSVLNRFTDKDQISDYAISALASLVKANALQGADQKLQPLAPATRAETAAFLYRIFY